MTQQVISTPDSSMGNSFSGDGMVADSFGKLISRTHPSGGRSSLAWSNDNGLTWSNSSDNVGVGPFYDDPSSIAVSGNTVLYVLTSNPSNNANVQRWQITRGANNNITAITHGGPDTNGIVTGGTFANPIQNVQISPNSDEVVVFFSQRTASTCILFRAKISADAYQSLDGIASSITVYATQNNGAFYGHKVAIHPVTGDIWIGEALNCRHYRFAYTLGTGNFSTAPTQANHFGFTPGGTFVPVADAATNRLYLIAQDPNPPFLIHVQYVDTDGSTIVDGTTSTDTSAATIALNNYAVNNGNIAALTQDSALNAYMQTFINGVWSTISLFTENGVTITLGGEDSFCLASGLSTAHFAYRANDNTLYHKSVALIPPVVVGTISGSTYLAPGLSATFTVAVTGGTAPYTYSWSFGSTTGTSSSFIITAKNSGTLSVTVTDALGVQSSAIVSVTVVYPSIARNVILEIDSGGNSTGKVWIDNKIFTLSPNPGAIAAANPKTYTIGVDGLVDQYWQFIFIDLPNGATKSFSIS